MGHSINQPQTPSCCWLHFLLTCSLFIAFGHCVENCLEPQFTGRSRPAARTVKTLKADEKCREFLHLCGTDLFSRRYSCTQLAVCPLTGLQLLRQAQVKALSRQVSAGVHILHSRPETVHQKHVTQFYGETLPRVTSLRWGHKRVQV